MNRHRKIYTENFGEIPEGYHVHHLDGNRKNNDPDNLIAVSPQMHYEIHLQQWERYGKRHDWFSAKRLAIEIGNPIPRGGTHSQESKDKISATKQGQEPWNKGTKGIMKPNSESFKPGNKPKAPFKKGHTPYNKGITGESNSRFDKYSISNQAKFLGCTRYMAKKLLT